jgi:hypothetical protein
MKYLIILTLALISCKKEEIYLGPFDYELELTSVYPSLQDTTVNLRWIRCMPEELQYEIDIRSGCGHGLHEEQVYNCTTVLVLYKSNK